MWQSREKNRKLRQAPAHEILLLKQNLQSCLCVLEPGQWEGWVDFVDIGPNSE